MEEATTFDTISDSPPTVESPEPEAGEENIPPIPEDKFKNPESHIADAKDGTSEKKESKKGESKTSEESFKASNQEGDDPAPSLVVGNDTFDLNELVKNPEQLAKVTQLIKDNELRRSDYSKKTADVARSREEFEQEKVKHFDEFNGWVSEMDSMFQETPRLFLLKTLGVDGKGGPLSPEQAEQAIHNWVKKLSGELKMGAEYNPSQLKKQYDLESRLRKMETDNTNKDQKFREEQDKGETIKLADYLKSKTVPKFSEGSPVSLLIEKLPWLGEAVKGLAMEKFEKTLSEEFVAGDPSWDDYKFIDNFDFNKTWSEVEKEIEEVYDVGREKYIERKKLASRKKPAGSMKTGAGGGNEKDWTFADLFSS